MKRLYTYEEVRNAESKGSVADGFNTFNYEDFKKIMYELVEVELGKDIDYSIFRPHHWKPSDIQIDLLKEKIKAGIILSPIVIRSDNSLMDGWHRLNAYYELGIKKIKAFRQVDK